MVPICKRHLVLSLIALSSSSQTNYCTVHYAVLCLGAGYRVAKFEAEKMGDSSEKGGKMKDEFGNEGGFDCCRTPRATNLGQSRLEQNSQSDLISLFSLHSRPVLSENFKEIEEAAFNS